MVDDEKLERYYNACRPNEIQITEWVGAEDRFTVRTTVPRIEPLENGKCGKRDRRSFRESFGKIHSKKKKCSKCHRERHDEHPMRHQIIDKIFSGPLEPCREKVLFLRIHRKPRVEKRVGHEVEPDDLRGKERKRDRKSERARDSDDFTNRGG